MNFKEAVVVQLKFFAEKHGPNNMFIFNMNSNMFFHRFLFKMLFTKIKIFGQGETVAKLSNIKASYLDHLHDWFEDLVQTSV